MNNIKYLLKLHQELYPNQQLNRIKNPCAEIILVDQAINEEKQIINSNAKMEEKLKSIIRTSALILLYQIFYDGNSHVARKHLSLQFNKLGYNLDYNLIKDMTIIPTFYYQNDKVTQNNCNSILKLIKTK